MADSWTKAAENQEQAEIQQLVSSFYKFFEDFWNLMVFHNLCNS